ALGVSGLGRAGQGRRVPNRTPRREAGHEPAATPGGPGAAHTPGEPGADRWQTQVRFPRRTGDVGVARDDLPVALRAGPRLAAARTDRVSAPRPVHAQAAATRDRTWQPVPRNGLDQPT